MEMINLGKTGLRVSRLCFGALTIGPLQANLDLERGAEVIAYALKKGINFIDTAQYYQTYPYIKRAISISGIKPIITAKSFAYDTKTAQDSFDKARKEMNVDIIDIFLLHQQETQYTMKGHQEALEFFCDQKVKGLIRAVGVSTHNIEIVQLTANMPEIDVIHPIVNKRGIGIGDGTIDQMLSAISTAHGNGKGIYAMKALGGGNLLSSYEESLKFVLGLKQVDSIAIGMQSEEEVDANINFFEGKPLDDQIKTRLQNKKRKLHIGAECQNCGACIKRCQQNALKMGDEITEVDMNKCVLCGYCAPICPFFAIKVI